MDKEFDEAILNALSTEVGAEGISLIISIFVEELSAYLAHLDAEPGTYDLPLMEVECHTMVSSARTVGMLHLANVSRQMEIHAAKGDMQAFSENIDSLRAAGIAAAKVLRHYLK